MKSERYERVMTAMRREVPDKLPWALWGHFPALPFLKRYSWEKANRDGQELAKAHIALLTELDYKMDLLKVTPFYRFMAYHWGSKFLFKNNEEHDETLEVVVKEPEDWQKLWVLDPKKELREHVKAVSILSSEIGRRMPFIYSIPSPLVQALHHVSSPARVYTDMRENPDALKAGLEIITETCIDFSKACMDEGATGIFFGIGGGGEIWAKMSREQLEEYGLGYDKRVLDVWPESSIRLLHICSNTQENPQTNGGLMEAGWFKKYPVSAINWWDTSFTRHDVGQQVYGDTFCIVAGLDQQQTMRYGTPQQVEDAVKQVIETLPEKGGFILGPGCTLFQDTPLANFNAVGRAVEKFGVFKR
jgi:uroporphyrinogen decarboxylase